MKIAVLTISDRSYNGLREDITGKNLIDYIKKEGIYTEIKGKILPDEKELIKKELLELSNKYVNLILTCGGTGFGKRDVTPEATMEVLDREAPGLQEYIRFENNKVNKNAFLSRGRSGVVNNTIVVNLPGSPDGALSCYKIISKMIEHPLSLLSGVIKDCKAE